MDVPYGFLLCYFLFPSWIAGGAARFLIRVHGLSGGSRPDQAFWAVSDQIGAAGFFQGLFDQSVQFRIPVLDQGPLHGLFMRIFRDIYVLHGPRIHAGIIHTGGKGGRRGIEILDLLRHIAQIPAVFGQFHRLLHGASGMGGHQIRDQVLLFPDLPVHFPEFFCKCFVDAVLRFAHEGEHRCGYVLRGHFQLAADMGGAGYIFTGEHDACVMHNSALCNLNVCDEAARKHVGKIFYSSSACIYPARVQQETDNPGLREDMAYPAGPDSEYGWEKLFSERLYMSYQRNYGLEVHIARFHNIFGPLGTWTGGREKAPAAMCRKVAEATNDGEIEIWGDGEQTRSFLYVDECVEAIRRLVNSDFMGPVNIGSEEMISINNLALMAAEIAGKKITLRHIDGPLGVRGRNSENTLIRKKLGWAPSRPLREGMEKTYRWIEEQVKAAAK